MILYIANTVRAIGITTYRVYKFYCKDVCQNVCHNKYLSERLSDLKEKEGMESTTILRRRMKKAGITLKSVAYLAGESEQTVCRILNKELIEKIHAAGNTLVKEANNTLTKELFEEEYEEEYAE